MCIEEPVCPICQEEFSESKKHQITLHCGHKYHKSCLREWLKLNASCPMCRSFTKTKITRRYSQIYYIQKLTEITNQCASLSLENNSCERLKIWNRMITLYAENPFIFINEKVIADQLKNLLLAMNDSCIKKDYLNLNDSKNEVILKDMTHKIEQIHSMLKHIS